MDAQRHKALWSLLIGRTLPLIVTGYMPTHPLTHSLTGSQCMIQGANEMRVVIQSRGRVHILTLTRRVRCKGVPGLSGKKRVVSNTRGDDRRRVATLPTLLVWMHSRPCHRGQCVPRRWILCAGPPAGGRSVHLWHHRRPCHGPVMPTLPELQLVRLVARPGAPR